MPVRKGFLVGFAVDPQGIYSPDYLARELQLRRSTLTTEMRLRRLRYILRAGRRWVLGEHLLEWLRAGEKRWKKTDLLNGQPCA